MYKIINLISILLFTVSISSAQVINLKNPSFEIGTPAIQKSAPSWSICPGGSPDLLDGSTIALCNVLASNGNQYIGILAAGWSNTGAPGLGEWLAQELNQPLKTGIEYHISIDIASSSNYNPLPGATDPSLYAGAPIYLQIRGLPDTCTNTGTELLWQSPTKIIRNNVFSRYDICFTPTSDHNAIGLVAYSDNWTTFGQVLIDNISPIVGISNYNISISSAILDSNTCTVSISGKAFINPSSIQLNGDFIGDSITPTMLNDSDWVTTINYDSLTGNDNVTISGIFGCTDTTLTDNINIDLSSCTTTIPPISPPLDTPLTIDIFVPNAFSPNSDGFNDILMVKNEAPVIIEYFNIFNKWGNFVYKGDNIQQGWDGNNKKGVPCNEGVYLYVLKVKNNNTIYKGTINLIR